MPSRALGALTGLAVLIGLAAASAPLAQAGRAAALLLAAATLIAWLGWRLHLRDRELARRDVTGPDPALPLDPSGHIRDVARPVFGIPPRQLTGRPLASLFHPEEAPRLAALLAAGSGAPGPTAAPFRLRLPDGSLRPVEVLVSADQAGGGLLCRLRDVSAWQDAVTEARAHTQTYALIAAQAGDMIVRVRPDRTRAYVSPSAEAVLGYQAETLRDMDFAEITHPDDRDRVATAFDTLVRHGGQTTCRFRMLHRNRGWIWVESRWTAQEAEQPGQGREVVAIVRDISARVAAEERTAFLARHDPLTGLANRTLFAERAERALVQGGAAVLCVDLDLFKSVNDSLGHAAGDALLCQVAGRLSGCARQTDTVARLGGDEFAILLPGAERAADAPGLAQRILTALTAPMVLDGHKVVASASLGIALAPADGVDYDTLLRRADAALYQAKARGRGQWQLFEPALERRRLARDRTLTALREAVARDDFTLRYLPSLSLANRKVTGVEALLRWNHPERGLIRPGQFLPLAEEAGLMAPLATFTLARAAADAALWPEGVGIAVNFSAAQLRPPDLAGRVLEALDVAGLGPERLEIEITGPTLAAEDGGALAELHQLRAAGVRLALDDFGAGHGGLGALRHFTVDRIKLDRGLISELTTSRAAREIARATAGLARGLGAIAAAEGVETAAQAELLGELGFVEAQGFLFSRPVPAEAVPALLAAAPMAVAA